MPDWKHWERYEELYGCTHAETQPTQFTKSNGVVCVYLQCKKCGEKVKEVRKAEYDIRTLPKFGEAFRDRLRAKAEEQRTALREQWEEENRREQDSKRREWWERYNNYLKSEQWKKVRRLALVRDNFICQNCFVKVTESNAHCHHISYKAYNLVGYSFVFEVVTLCYSCHKAYPKVEDDQ